jgi:hypothetical protein
VSQVTSAANVFAGTEKLAPIAINGTASIPASMILINRIFI